MGLFTKKTNAPESMPEMVETKQISKKTAFIEKLKREAHFRIHVRTKGDNRRTDLESYILKTFLSEGFEVSVQSVLNQEDDKLLLQDPEKFFPQYAKNKNGYIIVGLEGRQSNETNSGFRVTADFRVISAEAKLVAAGCRSFYSHVTHLHEELERMGVNIREDILSLMLVQASEDK